MKVTGLIKQIAESMGEGVADEASPVVALTRNIGVDLSSEDAWTEVPVLGAELDGDDCDLIAGSVENASPMTLSALRTALEALGPGALNCDVYVRGDPAELGKGWSVRQDVPVIATVHNAERRMFGVMPSYDGHEDELGN